MNIPLLKRAFQKRKDEMKEGIWRGDIKEIVDTVKKWDWYDVANGSEELKKEFLSDSIKAYNIDNALLSECSFDASKNIWMNYLNEKENM